MVERRAQQAAQRRGLDAGGPEGDGRIDARIGSVDLGFDPARPDGGDAGVGVDLDAQAAQRGFGLGGEVFGVGGQDARRTFEQQHAGFGRVDVAEVVAHIKLSDVGDGSGQLDAGGSAADDDEIERRVPAVFDHLAFGQFEGQQDTAANFGGVFDGLESRRERNPVVAAKVGVGGSGGQHKVVVGELWRRSAREIWRASASMPVTSSMSTSAFGWRRRMVRMGWAMSAGERTARATW